jgi:N-acetylmuramoyl-L-alanine amidase
MRRALLILAGFCLCLSASLSATHQDIAEAKEVFALKHIVIDPGHGGKDPGCIGVTKSKEKDITLKVALYLKEIVGKQKGYKVHLTRDSDESLSLSDRVEAANKYPPNESLVVSLHCNHFKDSKVHGLETYVFNLKASDDLARRVAARENEDEDSDPIGFILSDLNHRSCAPYSDLAAAYIHEGLVGTLKVKDRGIRKAPFRILARTRMPSVLVEIGYLSNAAECKKLGSAKYQKAAAQGIYEAIKAFAKEASSLRVALKD